MAAPISIIEWFLNFYDEARESKVRPTLYLQEAALRPRWEGGRGEEEGGGWQGVVVERTLTCLILTSQQMPRCGRCRIWRAVILPRGVRPS